MPQMIGKFFILYIVLVILCTAMPAYAASDESNLDGTLNVVVENDVFHSDRYYTNGIRASWMSKEGKASEWALKLAQKFPFFPRNAVVRANYAVGQNMYTPTKITELTPPRDDRPYAGWLYGSVGLIAETNEWLDQLELTVGMVGPASLAEQTQTHYHKLIGSDRPEGWDHQLKNEPGLILMYQRNWRSLLEGSFAGMPYDLTPHTGGSVGNVFTYANTGFVVRYGARLPLDYGPPRIQPSLPGAGFFVPQKGFSWYTFAGFDGRAVARNIFLDGNTFNNNSDVEKEIFVGDIQLGIVLTFSRLRAGYTHVFRTREFKTQRSVGQEFGALSVSMQF